MEENMIAISDPKTFCFNFDLPKKVDENLKHEIEFNMESNESLAEITIKMRLDNYCQNMFGNNIHRHRKHQNE